MAAGYRGNKKKKENQQRAGGNLIASLEPSVTDKDRTVGPRKRDKEGERHGPDGRVV